MAKSPQKPASGEIRNRPAVVAENAGGVPAPAEIHHYNFPGRGTMEIVMTKRDSPGAYSTKTIIRGTISIADVAQEVASRLEGFCENIAATSDRTDAGELQPAAGAFGLLQMWAPIGMLAFFLGSHILKSKVIRYKKGVESPWGQFCEWPPGRDMPLEEVAAAFDSNPTVQRLRQVEPAITDPPACDYPATPEDHRLSGLAWSLTRSPVRDGSINNRELDRLRALAKEVRAVLTQTSPNEREEPGGSVEWLLLKAMTPTPTTGAALARRANVKFNSHAKAALASLVKQNRCRLKRGRSGGYYI